MLGALAAAVGCDACAGQPAPPGTSSFFCTCECGVFVVGVALDDEVRLSPRFEVCLTDDVAADRGPLYARDVVELCDAACRDTISEAVRRVACVDRPDLCGSIECSEDVCRGAADDPGEVFDPRQDDDGGTIVVPDAGRVGFGFSASCRGPPDAGFAPCEAVDCALADVRAAAECGDLVLQEGEDCDGPCNVFSVCPTEVPGSHGVVGCSDACALQTDACVPPDVDAGPGPSDCLARNELALQRKILDVLAACSVIPAPETVVECEREATSPLCFAR